MNNISYDENNRLNYISFVISKVFTICWEDLENKIVRRKGPVLLMLIHELDCILQCTGTIAVRVPSAAATS